MCVFTPSKRASGLEGRTAPARSRFTGTTDELGEERMTRNVVRGILNLILAAAAAWLANYITEMIFGPEEEFE